MERIKALLAVALFVAGLIFGTPVISPRVELNKPSAREEKVRAHINNDTVSISQHTLQPVTNSDLVKTVE
jgi:hypothetical protein